MTALDARLALALMAKAERVFGQPGQVMAFPLSGAAYQAGQLNFVPTGGDAQALRQALVALSDFSAVANALPLGRAWQAAAGRADLPQVYRQVLEQAQVAELNESEADRQQLAAARALLIRTNLDGSQVDTPLYGDYKRCRDTWLLVAQQYAAAKASGELGADEAARQAWQLNEPLLKAALDKASDEWRVAGHKEEVEAAQARIDALTQRAPITQWHDWDMRSRLGTGTVTDLTGQPFWPTYLSPANACEVGWQQMVLTAGEVDALQASAPAEMKARLGAGTAALPVEQLQFEFTSAKLQRPWFDSGVFTSRFWRPRPAVDLTLSDGHEPFAGACPLYASAVVFFRRIRAVVRQPATGNNNGAGTQDDGLDLGIIKTRWAPRQAPPMREPEGIRPEVVDPAMDPPLHAGERRGAGMGARLLRAPGMLEDEGMALRVPGRIGGQTAGLTAGASASADGMVPLGIRRPDLRFSERDLVSRNLILRDETWSPPVIHEPAPPAAGTSVLSTGDDDIFILAFICTALPASPDPDPGLVWGAGG